MIEMQNVSFSYPDSADGGLKNINLTIPDEQCVLLCGRSGCGKTTLTRLINGLIPQFFAGELTGKVLLDGENLFDLPMYRIAEKVGSVFQNPRTQFFNVDTDSEIAFGMENEAVPQEQMGQRVVETAKALRIENLLGRNIFALSGGEKQKIAFASVYAMNPQIYLLDEPSSNLDMAAIHDLRAHLRLIKSQGKTIVVAEHRLYYLMDVADRIVYLDNGHIAGDWTPEQFRLLSTEKRQSMGLRALDLQDEKPICAAVPKQPPVLELQNVSLAYKKQPVLRNLSLQAAPGDIIAIVGHNGAGKTTFSRALCGLHKETSGSYLWNGNPQKPKERMKSSYMVMQDVNYQLFAESVEAECTFGIKHPDATLAMNIMPATLLSVLPIGGLLLKNGTLTPEKFVLIVILSMGLITPIIGCMKFTDDLAKVGTIISQVTDILTAPELSRPETDTESPQGSTVELRDVHFGYNDAEVLHGIDLVFPEGTVNALVGPSGSGKSTIAKLIASFWDVGSGSITVGGADIRSISAEHYNKLVAYVSQDNFLFDNTVRENIRMGRPDATDAEVEQAARDCGCYDFIMSLENGFNTQVGSGGGHLSGGEKQRISIARAMLKNAPIVILDEATAYTDPENEAIIQESVARLVRGKTLIVIAHRLSTIVDADQIVVVNDGCIEATGTQAELLQACPLYETLWNAHIASRDSAEGGADRA